MCHVRITVITSVQLVLSYLCKTHNYNLTKSIANCSNLYTHFCCATLQKPVLLDDFSLILQKNVNFAVITNKTTLGFIFVFTTVAVETIISERVESYCNYDNSNMA